MKKSMLLIASAIVLMCVIFCGCGNHTNALSNAEQMHESVSHTAQSTELPTVVTETTEPVSTAPKQKSTEPTESFVTTEPVPTAPNQKSAEPTESYEATESLVNDRTSHDYPEDTPTTEALCETTEPLYVSDYVYSDMELEVFELINQERTNAGVAPLKLSYVYSDCAHVRAMEADAVWSHTRPDGSHYSTVCNEYNLQNSYLAIGENLARGMASAEEAMIALMNSQGHRENILRPEFTTVSVSVVPMSGYPGYYVLSQIFVAEK